MEKKGLMKERIKRVSILLKELDYKIQDEQNNENVYTCNISDHQDFQGTLFIDRENKFLEVAFSYSFSEKMHTFLRNNLEEIMKVCYEYGCYYNLFKGNGTLTFSVFTKNYFSGLNYYSLRDNLKDFTKCTKLIGKIIDFELFKKASKGGNNDNP